MSKRRQSKGRAWHWKQTDAWYYTPPGTKDRVPLLDEEGRPIRGKQRKVEADLALARRKAAGTWRPTDIASTPGVWLVARVCSEYLQDCQQRAARGMLHPEYLAEAVRYLNDFCNFCGALTVAELRKGHIHLWIDAHSTWLSPVTQRNAATFVLAAFHLTEEVHAIGNPLVGLKKPPSRPRLQSFSPEDETALYAAADELLRNFLFAAIHTGLRPFCELARLSAEDVVETERGMMWRVFSTKTRKTRKIPVCAEVAVLTRKLLARAPLGSGRPLYGNSQGNPWKRCAGGGHFREARRKLGWEQDQVKQKYTCYTCRHTFAHRMLSGYWNGGAGCSIETLAELIGDTPKVAFDHYGREWGQHYQEPLWAAIGVGPEAGASTLGPRSS